MNFRPGRPALTVLFLATAAAHALPCEEKGEEKAAGIDQEELERLTAEILAEIESIRGREFPRPVAVAVADGETFLDYVKKRMERMTTPAEMEAQESMAKLFGLIPATMDLEATMMELLEGQVGGFYDPDSESFYIMEGLEGDLARVILAHELTHALDDQLYDIDGALEKRLGDSDRLFAYHAVVEGSGTAVMNRWTIEHLGSLDPESIKKAGEMGAESLEEAPPFLWKPLLASYLRGSAFLSRTDSLIRAQMEAPSNEDIEAAFAEPPRSSEQVLHPEKYWGERTRDEPVKVEIDRALLPEGWEVLHEDTMGELGLALMIEPPGKRRGLKGQLAVLAARYTFPASEGWAGDRYAVLRRGEAEVALALTRWDDPDEAREFHDELASLRAHLEGAAAACAAAQGSASSGFHLADPGTSDAVAFAGYVGIDAGEVVGLLAALLPQAGARPAHAPKER